MYRLLPCSDYNMIALNITIFESRAAQLKVEKRKSILMRRPQGHQQASSFPFRHDPWRHVVRILQQSLQAMVVKAHQGHAGYAVPCSLCKNHKMQ